jgi:hypothetical protein
MTWFHPGGRRDVDGRRRVLESRDRQLAPLGYAIDANRSSVRAARHCPRSNTSSTLPHLGWKLVQPIRCCEPRMDVDTPVHQRNQAQSGNPFISGHHWTWMYVSHVPHSLSIAQQIYQTISSLNNCTRRLFVLAAQLPAPVGGSIVVVTGRDRSEILSRCCALHPGSLTSIIVQVPLRGRRRWVSSSLLQT